MTRQTNQSSIDRQYLKAMGIDLWVDRNTATDDPLPDDQPLIEMSAPEFAVAVGNLKVSCSQPPGSTQLLVITEEPQLSTECTKLLGSMIGAIELNQSDWLHAGISQSDEAISIDQLEKTANPRAIIIMLRTGGNATALQSVRGVKHQAKMLQSFFVASYHPQDLLDNPDIKRPAWEDLKQLRQWLN